MVTFSLQNNAERTKEDFFLGVNRDLTYNRMLPKYYHWMIAGKTRKNERKKLCFNHILQLHSAIQYASGRICASRKRTMKQLWILNSLEKSLIILITIYISIGYDNWIVQRWTKDWFSFQESSPQIRSRLVMKHWKKLTPASQTMTLDPVL